MIKIKTIYPRAQQNSFEGTFHGASMPCNACMNTYNDQLTELDFVGAAKGIAQIYLCDNCLEKLVSGIVARRITGREPVIV